MKKKISIDLFKYMLSVGLIPIIIIYILNITLLDRYSLKMKRRELREITKELGNDNTINIPRLKAEKNLELYFYDLENPYNYNISEEIREHLNQVKWKEVEIGATIQSTLEVGQGIKLIVTSSRVTDTIFIIVTTPISSISDSIRVSRQFYYYSYLVAIILSLIIAYSISKKVSRPIEKLDKITKKLSNLDFSEKINLETGNEIESLGASVNIMSTKLEEAIGSLKESNKILYDDLVEEKKLEEMRKSFISSVNHELKTPLAIMKIYAEGLADGLAEEDEVDYYCQTIAEEVGNMERIISELLYFSEIDAGYKEANIEEFSIERLLNLQISKFNHDIEEKNITVERDIQVKIALGDSKLIERVAQNFLSNGINFVPKDGRMWVVVEDVGSNLRIKIGNNGEHIPEEKLEDIWKPFYKIEESRNRKYGGTGLGLSIVAKILEKHDSTYGVKNLEEGVEFSFTLNKIG